MCLLISRVYSPEMELGDWKTGMRGRHLFLLNFEPHEYITYSKKISKKIKRGDVRARKRERESVRHFPIRSSWDSLETDSLVSYYTIRGK